MKFGKIGVFQNGGTPSTKHPEYYGGNIVGVSPIFGTMDKVGDTKVFPLFTANDLPGYATYTPHECPYCKKGIPIEAMVNGFGYSKL